MRLIYTAGAVIVLVAAGACNGKNATTAAPDAEVDAPASSVAEALSGGPAAFDAGASDAALPGPVVHHRGLAGVFFRAALEADLTDEEKAAIEKIEEPIRSDPGPRHELAAYHADLAAAVKANRFEATKLQADEAAYAKALIARQDDQATALNGLHETLTAEQRKAVVESLRTSQSSHEHALGTAAPASDAGVSEWIAHRLERMKSQLVLDLDQQKEVGAVLARNPPPPAAAMQAHLDAMKKQMVALLNAFEKDTFDAKKLDLSAVPGKKPTASMDNQVKYLQQLMPILTAGQRDRLALSIEHPRETRDRGHNEAISEPFEMGGGMR